MGHITSLSSDRSSMMRYQCRRFYEFAKSVPCFIMVHHTKTEKKKNKRCIHPGRLTWNIIMEALEDHFPKWVIYMFHVNLPGCAWMQTKQSWRNIRNIRNITIRTIELVSFVINPRYPPHPMIYNVFGGFNPSEKYESNWIISPGFGVKIKNVWVATTKQYVWFLSLAGEMCI